MLIRDIIGEPNTTFERGLIYAVLSAADLQEATAYDDHAADLLALPEFSGLTLPAPIIQKYADQLQEIEESQIIVSPALRKERQAEIYARATEEALGERSRWLMRLRLEEMAYYLLQTERRREALWAVAAAQSLQQDHPDRLRHNPFAGALLGGVSREQKPVPEPYHHAVFSLRHTQRAWRIPAVLPSPTVRLCVVLRARMMCTREQAAHEQVSHVYSRRSHGGLCDRVITAWRHVARWCLLHYTGRSRLNSGANRARIGRLTRCSKGSIRHW